MVSLHRKHPWPCCCPSSRLQHLPKQPAPTAVCVSAAQRCCCGQLLVSASQEGQKEDGEEKRMKNKDVKGPRKSRISGAGRGGGADQFLPPPSFHLIRMDQQETSKSLPAYVEAHFQKTLSSTLYIVFTIEEVNKSGKCPGKASMGALDCRREGVMLIPQLQETPLLLSACKYSLPSSSSNVAIRTELHTNAEFCVNCRMTNQSSKHFPACAERS